MMNSFAQTLSETIARMLSGAPATIARNLPKWLGQWAKAYVRWLWRLDTVMSLVMLAVNVVVLQLIVADLPGPTIAYRQLAGAVSILLAFFVLASILFGGRRSSK
jgi:hypothetical protein